MHTSVLSLEAAGLVERSARNQRVVLVRPTDAGRKCLETATRRVRVVEHAALADLSRDDARTVRAWLANLAAMTTSTRGRGCKVKRERSHEPSGPGDREFERRIHDAERNLFAAVGADVDEFFLDLAHTGLRARVLSHGRGPAVVLLHGASERRHLGAVVYKLGHVRLLAVDLPGHGLSDRSPSGAGRCASTPAR